MNINNPWVRRMAAVAIGLGLGAGVVLADPVVNGVARLSAEPVLDGKLDDVCWKDIPAIPRFFAFRTEPPLDLPPELQTMAKLGFTRDALYVAVYCYEQNPAAIRVQHTKKDDGSLWEDDCIEIYISPENRSNAVRKFTINSVGNTMDMLGNDSNWNAEGWTVATARQADGWSVELRIPWGDLGRTPKEADIWGFALLRFSWTTGAFRGVTSAPGMHHGRMNRMGYLVFGEWEPLLNNLITALTGREGPVWRLPCKSGYLKYADYGNEVREQSAGLPSIVQECGYMLWRSPAGSLTNQLQQLDTELQTVSKQVPAEGPIEYNEWNTLTRRIRDLCEKLETLRLQIAYDQLWKE